MHSDSIEVQNTRKKILVIEDNPLVMNVLKTLLSEQDYEVYSEDNGQSALDRLKSVEADLILCDVMMPVMDGFTLQAKLLEQGNHDHIPFVFLTALSDSENVTKGNSCGADAYVIKPFDPSELLATIKGKIERSRLIHKFYKKKQEDFSLQVIRQISHEFRTPLVAVTTGSELLLNQQDNLGKDKLNALISTIWRGGQRLEKIVNNFILLQQIQAGQAQKNYTAQVTNFNLIDFLKEYRQRNQAAWNEESCQVDFEFDLNENCQISASKQQLSLILDRLFDNSIKFSLNQKNIKIRIFKDPRFLKISIADQGSGFDPKCFRNLTQIFYQHDRETNEQQGSGLGLVICKFLARINRGRIKFENNQDGGAVVTLSLPRA